VRTLDGWGAYNEGIRKVWRTSRLFVLRSHSVKKRSDAFEERRHKSN
jgi:hypothetical protein